MELQLCPFLTVALDEGYWSGLCRSCFTHKEKATGLHQIGYFVGPIAILDTLKDPFPCQDLNTVLKLHVAANMMENIPERLLWNVPHGSMVTCTFNWSVRYKPVK